MCTTQSDLESEITQVDKVLAINGYPSWILKKARALANSSENNTESIDKEKPKATIVVPYVQHFSEGLKRIMSKVGIRTCFSHKNTIRNAVVKPKDKVLVSEKTGVIYKYNCKDCDKVYIGETETTADVRK